MASQEKKKSFWNNVDLRSFERLVKYRGAVGMLLIALLAFLGVLFLIAWEAKAEAVLVVLGSLALAALIAFFGSAIWMVKKLGIFAVAEGHHLVKLREIEVAAKGDIDLSGGPIITNPIHPQLTAPETSELEDE